MLTLVEASCCQRHCGRQCRQPWQQGGRLGCAAGKRCGRLGAAVLWQKLVQQQHNHLQLGAASSVNCVHAAVPALLAVAAAT